MPGELTAAAAPLMAFLLVLTRVTAVFVFLPFPGRIGSPAMAKTALSAAITLALSPQWPRLADVQPSMAWMAAAVASEAALGLVLGLVVQLLNEAVLACFQMLGLQAGYTFASTVDPATQADTSVLQSLGQLAAGLMFFAIGLDHEILRAFSSSLATQPPGRFVLQAGIVPVVVSLLSGIFSTGLRLAMPVLVAMLMVDLALALIGRINPQLQLLPLAFPLKMLASLALISAVIAVLGKIFRELSEGALAGVRAALGAG